MGARTALGCVLALAGLTACSVELEGPAFVFDGATPPEPVSDAASDARMFDARQEPPDDAAIDARQPGLDAAVDAREPEPDTGVDARVPAPDTSVPPAPVCDEDALALGALSIEDALALNDGAALLGVGDALVTYVQPAVGDAEPGFYVQAAAGGPGLFVAIPASELSPAPEPGDCVRFDATQISRWDGATRVVALEGYERLATDRALEPVQLDLGLAQLAEAQAAGNFALATVLGTLASDFAFASSDSVGAWIATQGIPAGGALRLRVPNAAADHWTLVRDCVVRARGVVRQLEPGVVDIVVHEMAALEPESCAAPRLISAGATSATTVLLQLDRRIDPETLDPSGAQLDFSGALVAQAAALSSDGRTITVLTSVQTAFAEYEVSIDATLTDTLGAPLPAAEDTAQFFGHGPVAEVRINEINANLGQECDLLELRVVTGGTMDPLELWTRDGPVALFSGMIVETNDLIVVHFGSMPACTTGVMQESSSPNEHPSALNALNFDGAIDRVTAETLSNVTNVLSIRHREGEVLEAVLYADAATGTVAAFTEAAAVDIAASSEWTAPNGTVPEGGFVDEAFRSSAVLDSNATGALRDGTTMQRLDNLDRNTRDDWDNTSTLSPTWAALNPGQTEL